MIPTAKIRKIGKAAKVAKRKKNGKWKIVF